MLLFLDATKTDFHLLTLIIYNVDKYVYNYLDILNSMIIYYPLIVVNC